MTLTSARPDKAFWLAAIQREATALRAVTAVDDALASPVPSCPGWTVGDLFQHTGAGLRWVAAHVVRGETGSPGDPSTDGAPTGDDLLPWWDAALAAAVTALDGTEPDLPAWNWAPQDKVARFWYRRFAHELAVHRWDGQVAVGLPEPIETALAVDGIDEVLDTWLPADGGLAKTGDGVVQLIADDSEDSWIVRIRGGAISLLDTATLLPEEHTLQTQASGSASDLELALYGRVPFDILTVTGNETLLDCLRIG
jgi:uncharacterized protein (TIGR03083 family)